MTTKAQLCLVEDDDIMRMSLCQRFKLEGLSCDCYESALEALPEIKQKNYQLLISDINIPQMSGEELFKTLLDSGITPPPTIFITGYGTIDQAVELLKIGASDYISKPFDIDDLISKIKSISPALFDSEKAQEDDLGVSTQMKAVMEKLRLLAAHDVDVLITGESGVGKEYAARYLCTKAQASDKPFIAVNCAALPEDLLEAELFGHEKGAFTGASKTRRGVFEQADGGVLFLDEIGETSARMQAKLLRCIQERVVQRIGSEVLIPVDFRLIYATNKNLVEMVNEGSFREDLFYRINVAHVHIPPLRERKSDIAWMVHKVVEQHCAKYQQRKIILPITERYLEKQYWPGNLRELKNSVERVCILSQQEVIGPNEFYTPEQMENEDACNLSLKESIEQYEENLLRETLEHHEWRINESAVSLGISRKSLWEKMRRYEIG